MMAPEKQACPGRVILGIPMDCIPALSKLIALSQGENTLPYGKERLTDHGNLYWMEGLKDYKIIAWDYYGVYPCPSLFFWTGSF